MAGLAGFVVIVISRVLRVGDLAKAVPVNVMDRLFLVGNKNRICWKFLSVWQDLYRRRQNNK